MYYCRRRSLRSSSSNSSSSGSSSGSSRSSNSSSSSSSSSGSSSVAIVVKENFMKRGKSYLFFADLALTPRTDTVRWMPQNENLKSKVHII